MVLDWQQIRYVSCFEPWKLNLAKGGERIEKFLSSEQQTQPKEINRRPLQRTGCAADGPER
jgi:hypothetical protein